MMCIPTLDHFMASSRHLFAFEHMCADFERVINGVSTACPSMLSLNKELTSELYGMLSLLHLQV